MSFTDSRRTVVFVAGLIAALPLVAAPLAGPTLISAAHAQPPEPPQLAPLAPPVPPALPVNPELLEFAPLSEKESAALEAAKKRSRLEVLCGLPIDLKVQNADLETIVAQIIKTTEADTPIEVRGEYTAQFSLNLKDTSVVQILTSLANLNGSELYVLEDRLLISPYVQLNDTEAAHSKRLTNDRPMGIVSPSGVVAAGLLQERFTQWVEQLIADAPEETPREQFARGTLRMGDLNPEMQELMQYGVGGRFQSPSLQRRTLYPADTIVTFYFLQPGALRLSLEVPGPANPLLPGAETSMTRNARYKEKHRDEAAQ